MHFKACPDWFAFGPTLAARDSGISRTSPHNPEMPNNPLLPQPEVWATHASSVFSATAPSGHPAARFRSTAGLGHRLWRRSRPIGFGNTKTQVASTWRHHHDKVVSNQNLPRSDSGWSRKLLKEHSNKYLYRIHLLQIQPLRHWSLSCTPPLQRHWKKPSQVERSPPHRQPGIYLRSGKP